MKVGVLALQGAFTEHEDMLSRLGAECFEIRRKQDLTRPMDGLVLPGGESTVMGKLLRELELFQPLKEKILEGLPRSVPVPDFCFWRRPLKMGGALALERCPSRR